MFTCKFYTTQTITNNAIENTQYWTTGINDSKFG